MRPFLLPATRGALALAAGLCVHAGPPGPSAAAGPPAEARAGAAPGLPDCATAPLRATGPVYYYCDCREGAERGCRPGDDANPGTSPRAPRRSLADAAERFNSMGAGGTVALCRGGAFVGRVGIANPRCRAADDSTWCEFRDYVPPWGSPGSARPRIDAGAGNAFMVWNSQGAYEGYRFWNLDVRHSARHVDGPRSFFVVNRQRHVDVCNVRGEGGSIGVETNRDTEDVTIRDSTWVHYGYQGMYLESDRLVVDGNVFVDNGDQTIDPGKGGWMHTIYVACNDAARPCRGVRIVNNHLRTNPDGDWGRCRGHMLILRGHLPGIVVENNLVEGSGPYGCGGLSLSGSFARTEIRGAVVRRNRILWGEGRTTVMQVDGCRDCVVTDNLVEHAGGPGSIGMIHPEHASTDPGSTAGPTTGTVIQNNTFRMVRGGVALQIAKEGRDFVVENNAAWTEGEVCFDVRRPTLRFAANHCRSRGGPPPGALWVDAPGGDYRPAAGGPLAGAGDPAHHSPVAVGSVRWSPADAGAPRAGTIDIGAFRR